MITETDAGHIIFDDLRTLGLEIRLKGHLHTGRLDGETPMVGERVPEDGMIVIIPKRVTADKDIFNECTIEVNVLLNDMNGETHPNLDGLTKRLLGILTSDKVGVCNGDWYRYSVRSHGIEEEANMKCHYGNITIDFEILNVRK